MQPRLLLVTNKVLNRIFTSCSFSLYFVNAKLCLHSDADETICFEVDGISVTICSCFSTFLSITCLYFGCSLQATGIQGRSCSLFSVVIDILPVRLPAAFLGILPAAFLGNLPAVIVVYSHGFCFNKCKS